MATDNLTVRLPQMLSLLQQSNHNSRWRDRTIAPCLLSRTCTYNWLCRCLLTVLLFLGLPNLSNVHARDVRPQREHYTPNYNYYHNVSQIGTQIQKLVARNPNYIKLDLQYKSRSSIPQYVLHISNFSNARTESGSFSVSMAKPKILLSFGEHAREFFPVESLFYLLNNITRGLSAPHGSPTESFSRLILSRVDLYVIGMANPDGRRHIERTKNFCWRGTSVGVDLNRNFDWRYGGKGSSGDPKDEEYRGPFVHSEPECQVYLDLTSLHAFDAFLSLHSGIKQIYIPFADSESKKTNAKPVYLDEQLDMAQMMAQATQNAFSYGVAYNLNDYPADGTVFDYMAGVRKIPFSFAIELWGEGDSNKVKCFDLFNPSHATLQGALQDIMPIYDTLFTYMIHWKEKQVHKLFHQDEEPEFGLPFGYILVAITFCLFVLMLCHQYKPYGFHFYQRKRVVSLRSLSSTFAAASGIKMT
ncbi:carboxypeptidase A2-like [Patiria miniata]|uniref:Peptidase M14 domain-containing protein n=1 Tax=Patiria miniata TaxID=46514 RepID=A0A914BMH7_PATMI|nr:carboxypeptidase A2-like [Patiria miniata]XP_038076950.1 carboxypeptidase A2-like [Patiria miniata]XP_038076951.1 carboxypeptidase A2-like [Patiria miniata]